jgi:general secretion pathway protein C
MSEDGSDPSPFQEKPDWKGKLKGIFQKQKEEITGLIARASGKKPPPDASPLAPDAAPFMGSAPPPREGEDRTFTGMIRMHWNERVKPKFTRMRKNAGSGGGSGFAPPPGPGFTWNEAKLNFIAILASIVLIAWTGADLAAFFVEKWIPEPPVSRFRIGAVEGAGMKPFSDYQGIIGRNLFSSLGKIPGDEVQGIPNQDNEPVKSTLPLDLIGTVILKNGLNSIATIQDKGENQVYPMRVDDELPGKIKVLEIQPYKVIFRNVASGRKEFIDMPEEGNGTRITVGSLSSRKPPSDGIEQTAPNQFNIPRAELDKYLSNINDVLTQARAIPHFENGQPAGYKLIQIVKGSVYEKLGLQNGDILCGVNGENINDPSRAFELLNQLKTASSLELCVKRGGRQTTQSYNFR